MLMPRGGRQPEEPSPYHEWRDRDGSPICSFFREDCGFVLRFPAVGDFRIAGDGGDIACFPLPNVGEDTVNSVLMNQVVPLALSVRGERVYHGSAVDFGDEAVAFVGASGLGKSTLAASFATSGIAFLTDDALHVAVSDGDIFVTAGDPSLRLWDDSRMALVGSRQVETRPTAYAEKTRLLAGTVLRHCSERRLLRRIYHLGDGEARQVEIRAIAPLEVVPRLVSCSFLLELDTPDVLAAHFHHVTEVAAAPVHFKLDFPRSFAMLPEVRRAILHHLETWRAT